MRFYLIIAVTLLGLSSFAVAAPHHCAKLVAEKLAQLDVAPPQIKRMVFVDIVEDGRSPRLVGYEAWVDLKQCRGSVVLKMSRQCEVRETYSRGACDISGLKNYR